MAVRISLVATLTAAFLAADSALAGPKLLIDLDTGGVLAAEDAGLSWHPASLTKVMTAHLALKAVKDGALSFDAPVIMSLHAASMPPSKLGLKPGNRLSLEAALKAMLTRSTNDVAVAVAEAVAGSEDRFAAEMTKEARLLGMSATRFVNASGLHDDRQVTTARDIAVLAMAVRRAHPEHLWLFSMKSVEAGGKTLRSTNSLLGKYPGIDGMKTGYVCASGFNIVATALQGGRRLAAVVLGEASGKSREAAVRKLLDLGFSRGDREGGSVASFEIRTPSAAPDLRKFACGKKWKGDSGLTLAGEQPLPQGSASTEEGGDAGAADPKSGRTRF